MAATLTEIDLQADGRADRLPPMLFLAALAHGILILGVTFNMVLMPETTKSNGIIGTNIMLNTLISKSDCEFVMCQVESITKGIPQ